MSLKRFVRGMTLSVLATGLSVAAVGAAEEKGVPQTKTGIVKKVDANAKQIVVMAARELTFTITDSTKVQQHGTQVKLSDIKLDANVLVEYVKDGDTRTAKKIVLLKEK